MIQVTSFLIFIVTLNIDSARARPLLLKVGEPQFIPAARMSPVIVPKGGFLKVVDQGARLKVWAKKPGSGTLRIGSQALPLVAMDASVFNCTQIFQELVEMFQGLELRPAPLEPEVTGELWRLRDWQMITTMAQKHQCPFRFNAQVPKELEPKVEKWLHGELAKKIALFKITLSPTPTLELGDRLSKEQQRKLALWGLQVMQRKGKELAPLLRIEMLIAEISKTQSRNLGLEWQDGQSVQLLPKAQFNGTLEQLIRFLGANGNARTMAEPSLTVRSGDQAEFVSGGEIPIRQVTLRRQQVSWKPYGLTLRVKPELINSERSLAQIESEISAPDFSQEVDGVPSMRRHRFSSQVNVEVGQWIALNTLRRNDSGQDRSGLVLGMNLPILHPLFGRTSKGSSHQQSFTFLRITHAQENSHDQ